MSEVNIDFSIFKKEPSEGVIPDIIGSFFEKGEEEIFSTPETGEPIHQPLTNFPIERGRSNMVCRTVSDVGSIKAYPLQKKYVNECGEILFPNIYANTMEAKSESERNIKLRGVCIGRIANSKIIRYIIRGCIKSYYQINTVDRFGNNRCLIVYDEDFHSTRLINILEKDGGLAFAQHKRKREEAELIQNYILITAESTDVVFPETPSWVDGKYMFSHHKHRIDTPFFKNSITISDKRIGEKEAFENLLEVLSIFYKTEHRIFFMIIYLYTVIRGLIPVELRFDKVFSVNSEASLIAIIRNLFCIFNREYQEKLNVFCDLAKLRREIDVHKGAALFFENREVTYSRYLQNKNEDNITEIGGIGCRELLIVIFNANYEGHIPGMFNVTVKSTDVDVEKYYEFLDKVSLLTEHIIYFADWISSNEYYTREFINSKIAEIYEEGDDNDVLIFKLIYMLIAMYAKDISVDIHQAIGSDEKVGTSISDICECSRDGHIGEWILERFGEIYTEMCINGECRKIKINRGDKTDIVFYNDKPTFIEKSGCIYIREADLKYIIKHFPDNMTENRLKKALAIAGALETDAGEPYRKNLYIPCMNKSIRMLAVRKTSFTRVGEIEV